MQGKCHGPNIYARETTGIFAAVDSWNTVGADQPEYSCYVSNRLTGVPFDGAKATNRGALLESFSPVLRDSRGTEPALEQGREERQMRSMKFKVTQFTLGLVLVSLLAACGSEQPAPPPPAAAPVPQAAQPKAPAQGQNPDQNQQNGCGGNDYYYYQGYCYYVGNDYNQNDYDQYAGYDGYDGYDDYDYGNDYDYYASNRRN